MSVYTTIDNDTVQKLLLDYSLGSLVDIRGITGGIENSNYFLITSTHRCVLTIIEQFPLSECDWFIKLNNHLQEHKFLAPKYYHNNKNQAISSYHGKALVISERISGASIDHPELMHIMQVAIALAKFHNATQSFLLTRQDSRSTVWREQCIAKLHVVIPKSEFKLIQEEHTYQATKQTQLPQGIIHSDLFKDNVLFHENKLNGIIDYYYACHASLIYDLAVAINDWCVVENQYKTHLVQIFISSYEQHRKLQNSEFNSLPDMLRLAALRFWISRLMDFNFPKPGLLLQNHDPDQMKAILLQARLQTLSTLGLV
ncbi:MAG: homoserine kinase [Methylacidiphilales bacterium]|nr:homoserine kinase [Candidatus Methylacidiphilales bacterium]